MKRAVLGIAGWSGAGKTTLIEAVLPLLRRAGLVVSTIKHAHHGAELDTPGKDSWRHRQAGACEVLIATPGRWALMHEVRGEEPGLDELLAVMSPGRSHTGGRLPQLANPETRSLPAGLEQAAAMAGLARGHGRGDARGVAGLRPDGAPAWRSR